MTKRAPTDAELRDLKFAFRVAKHVKSNTIIYAKDLATVGIGAGQMSRVDSARIAARKAQDAAAELKLAEPLTKGSVVASDAFFPFADGMLACIEAGATAVIQPGGSMRDDEVIKAADEHGIAMVFTGVAAFPALRIRVRELERLTALTRANSASPADEEHHQHRHAGLLARGDRGDDADQQRADEGRHLSGQREQAEILRDAVLAARAASAACARRPAAGRRPRRSGSRARDRRARPRRRTTRRRRGRRHLDEQDRSLSTSRIATIASSRTSMLPAITRFGPRRSSSLPPSHAPNAPAIASMMPKVPIWIVCQPKVPAA